MGERTVLMGMETEYSFTGLAENGTSHPRHELLARLMQIAAQTQPHLSDPGHQGLFLRNGGRLYIDSGMHPEVGTPECPHPWDVVRYVRAGDRILLGLARRLESDSAKVSRALVLRGNVDYGGTGASWGCHESYLHRADPERVARNLLPHLVSRVIFTGAGGFHSLSAGLEFTLSPRVAHLAAVQSDSSTHGRGILHTKDEAFCGGGYKRLHLLCADSLCSDTALWLLVGTTALAVVMAEAGVEPGAAVRLESPLDAMRAVASDPECGAPLRLANGEETTALAIQRHYLALAQAHARAAFMPPWAESVCSRWRAVLDGLERDPRRLAATLDWAMKLALYRRHAERRGIDWRTLPVWTRVIEELRIALGKTDSRAQTLTADHLQDEAGPLADRLRDLTPLLREKGLDRSGLGPILALRDELFEIDTRFGQLGEGGIFEALDREGVLDHRVPGAGDVGPAMQSPPETGRGRVRGNVVRDFSRNGDRYVASWHAVWDLSRPRVLDLTDPFEERVQWKSPWETDPGPWNDRTDVFTRLGRMGL